MRFLWLFPALAALAGCASSGAGVYETSATFRASLGPFSDCAFQKLQSELGPGFTKADLPSAGETRISQVIDGWAFVEITVHKVDQAAVSAKVAILPSLLAKESLRNQVFSILAQCGQRTL